MSEMMTFDVHIRVRANGATTALTDREIAEGNSLDSIEAHETADGPHHDFVIRVTVPCPVPMQIEPAAEVTIPAQPAPPAIDVSVEPVG